VLFVFLNTLYPLFDDFGLVTMERLLFMTHDVLKIPVYYYRTWEAWRLAEVTVLDMQCALKVALMENAIHLSSLQHSSQAVLFNLLSPRASTSVHSMQYLSVYVVSSSNDQCAHEQQVRALGMLPLPQQSSRGRCTKWHFPEQDSIFLFFFVA
jgi:hypothetical protein